MSRKGAGLLSATLCIAAYAALLYVTDFVFGFVLWGDDWHGDFIRLGPYGVAGLLCVGQALFLVAPAQITRGLTPSRRERFLHLAVSAGIASCLLLPWGIGVLTDTAGAWFPDFDAYDYDTWVCTLMGISGTAGIFLGYRVIELRGAAAGISLCASFLGAGGFLLSAVSTACAGYGILKRGWMGQGNLQGIALGLATLLLSRTPLMVGWLTERFSRNARA